MKTALSISLNKETIKGIIIDFIALAFIYFIPSLAHLLNFPVYMMEPMRLMLVISIAHSSKKNSYLLALTLPLFSFIVSSHPELGKMLIITAELVLNVFLFYILYNKIKNVFVSMITSILVSKIACYLLYLIFFSLVFVKNEADGLFLAIQAGTSLLFSLYLFVIWRKKQKLM